MQWQSVHAREPIMTGGQYLVSWAKTYWFEKIGRDCSLLLTAKFCDCPLPIWILRIAVVIDISSASSDQIRGVVEKQSWHGQDVENQQMIFGASDQSPIITFVLRTVGRLTKRTERKDSWQANNHAEWRISPVTLLHARHTCQYAGGSFAVSRDGVIIYHLSFINHNHLSDISCPAMAQLLVFGSWHETRGLQPWPLSSSEPYVLGCSRLGRPGSKHYRVRSCYS